MKILIVTDAWHPQVNGVVRTLGQVAHEAPALGSQVTFLTPCEFRTLPMPSYPEIKLSLVLPRMIERRLDAANSYRLEARGFCTQPAHAVRGKGDVLVSTFEFAGPVTYETPKSP